MRLNSLYVKSRQPVCSTGNDNVFTKLMTT